MALAEVAAAFAGFSGVVAALGHRSPSDWSPAARFRFQNLLTVSVAASLFAFLPVAIAHFAPASPAVWTVSGGALALFCVLFLVRTFRRGLAVRTQGGLRRWMAVVWITGMSGVAVAQLAGMGVAGPYRGALYVGGILVLLAISGLQFILLALGSVDEQG